MQLKKSIYIIPVAIGLLIFTACTEGFEELNTDPNSFNTSPPENLFAGVVKNTIDLVGGVMNDRMYLNYASYIGGKGGAQPRFGFDPGIDGYWSTFYVDILKNTQEIIDNYGDDPDYANRAQIAKIWKSYIFSIMVSTYGPVPFEEALGESSTTSYDTEEEITEAIMMMLKEAAENITPDGDRLLDDPIFGGDNELWIKFANSLRLKIALRVSYGFPSLAQTHGAEVMANEDDMITSNAENIYMQWETIQENWSFNYNNYVFGDPLPDVIPYGNHHFILNLKTYADPRLPILFQEGEGLIIQEELFASGSNTDLVTVQHEVPYFGRPLGNQSRTLDEWNLNGADNILQGFNTAGFSQPSEELFFAQDMAFNIITYSELLLMKAEAALKGWGGSKTAEEYYYDGIRASFDQLGASGVEEYIVQDGIAWGTSSEGDNDMFGVVTSGISADPLDKIIRQRWITMYYQGHDAWAMEKRTRLLPTIPHFGPDGTAENEWGYALIPERMMVATTESGTNPEGYSQLESLLGGPDELYTPLKMNKPPTGIEWQNLPAFFNQEFAEGYYGQSVDDLIAAGVDYTIVE